MSLAHGNRPIVTEGLVLCLDVANSRSYPGTGTTWFDLSGNGNHCTLVNDTSYSTENSGTFVLDGVDDYIKTPQIVGTGSSTNSLTWCIWTKPASLSGNIMSMSRSDPQGSWNMPPIAATNGVFRGKIWSNLGLISPPFTLGLWYHVCLTFNYSAVASERAQRLYVNGSLVSEQTDINYSASGVDNFLYFGQANPGSNNTGNYAGSYGCAQVYSGKALTADEVAQNFNAMRGRYGL